MAKYLIVTNLTPNDQIIVPARRDMAGQDLVIPAFSYLEVDEPRKWQDERNLMRAQSQGLVRVEWLDERPEQLPELPRALKPSDARLYNMIREIVFGDDARANDMILATPQLINQPKQPPDYAWLETSGTAVLMAAKTWLELWGPPEDRKWRIGLIETRLQQIKDKTVPKPTL